MDLIDLVLDRLHHFAGVPATEHEDDASDGFVLAIHYGCAMPDGMPDPDLGYVPHIYRRATHFLDDDTLDIFQRFNQPHPANHVLFVVLLEDISSGIGIILGDGVEDVVKGKAI